jgi:Bax protein
MRLLLLLFLLIPQFSFAKGQDFIKKISSCAEKIQNEYPLEERVPIKLIVAQAVLESNWGKSRFAIEGNNFFGIRTWDLTRSHLKPLANSESKFGLVVYSDMCSSVKDYLFVLNTSEKYSNLRRIRFIELKLWGSVDPILLAKHLEFYSEEGDIYVAKVVSQIKGIENY